MTDAAATVALRDRLRDGPILETLIALSAPNLVALLSAAVVTIGETMYVGRLGVASLAGVTLVFPVIMLMQMMSAGAMGGGISGAVSRALGAGDVARARSLAFNALAIGAAAGAVFAIIVGVAAPTLFALLGGSGAALSEATSYARVAAFAIAAIWIANTLASVARGAGDMAGPAYVILLAGVLQLVVGGALGLGVGPAPRLGVAGVACGQVVGFTCAAVLLVMRLRAPTARVRLSWTASQLDRARIRDILRVGLPATLSPIQAVLTILILTALAARFGPEALAGYGIGARLEFLLIPIAFSVGVACVPMVGAAIGAGNVARARRVAWTAGALATGVLGLLGALVMIAPDLWGRLFVNDEAVLSVTRQYLRIAGLGFPFFGMALCLYFASQGAGRVAGPIAAQALRLAIVVAGGWLIVATGAPLWTLFALSTVAIAAQGLGTAAAIHFTPWGATR